MDEQIEKLINQSGGSGLYQIVILILGFWIWNSNSLIHTSIAILEKMPQVEYKNETTDLTYEICNEGDYKVVKRYDFSWISDMDIECDPAKVGYIGSFLYFGSTAGNFGFSIISKYLMHKEIIIIFSFTYAFFLFLTTIINNLYFRLFCFFIIGICQGLANPSTITIVSESVSSKKRSFFAGIINMGYSFCPIIYTYIYVYCPNWKYVFWLQNIIAIICVISYTILLNNSARTFFSKNKYEEGIEILKKIAKFNGKLEQFEKDLNNEEYDSLLRKDEKGIKTEIINDSQTKLGYSALFKYRSVRYKFINFSVVWMIMTFLTNAIVINTKKMKGDFYINNISLFFVEIIANTLVGFIINIPSFGRKNSLRTFYIGVTFGFVLYILFDKLEVSSIASLFAMAIIRFSCTGVFTSYYIYFMESYPTSIRALGFGLNQTLGSLAGCLSPFVIEFFNEIVLYISFAILVVVDIALTFFVPETVGKPMLETIEEIEAEKTLNENDIDNAILGRVSDSMNDSIASKGEDQDKKEGKNDNN